MKRAEGQIEIRLPERRTPPETVVAHLGPTNSGKTHDAIAFLAEQGRGVYAGPLRMLAQEAHRRLAALLGDEQVGLVTGEERLNDDAPILCCTVEMAPGNGEVLVLDEVQWADDEERGAAWTELLLAGEYRHIRLLGALDALPLVRRAFPDAELRVHERKLPLEFVGARQLRALTPGSVVVAFSRKAVLALAGEINRLRPDRVAVLYGAMPLASRREEIDRFLAGSAEVCVATDVLGHGVNLPCETLLFAETTKFDGVERRDLLPWELAQIAGRAGRFGLVERGHVGVLVGVPWANADPDIVESALVPHVVLPEGHRGYRIVDEARIGPRLGDLGVDDARDLDAALGAWHRVATREWAHESWLAVESLQPLRGRLAVVQRHLRERGRSLGLDDTWRLANAPIDPDGAELLGVLALAVSGDRAQRPLLQFLLDTSRLRDARLEEAEEAGRVGGSCAGSRSSTRVSEV
ncbi:MAG TPA: helicase-related protein [Gaiella sp.]